MQRSEEIDGNWNRYRLEILDIRDKADISRYYIYKTLPLEKSYFRVLELSADFLCSIWNHGLQEK